jgi:putative glutamine amidotransferase
VASPLIAVTSANTPDKRGFDRASLNLTYLRAIEEAGGIPLVVSPGMAPEHLAAAMRVCSGLVLTGGGDVDPALYGEEPHPTIIGVSALRDTMEFAALEIAFAGALPVLALCRGMQVLNVWRGGKLIQDIPSMVPGAFGHSVQEPRHGAAHSVTLRQGCRLAELLGATVVDVNSRHHQALSPDAIGDGLVVTGRAMDGVIEAVELPGEQFVVGVQWHAEDMATGPEDGPPREHARALYSAFVAETRAFGEWAR